MSNNALFYPAKPSFPIKYSLYMKIIDSIPFGKLSTFTAINAFIADVYSVENVQLSAPDLPTRYHEICAGVNHAWQRIVSDTGLIQDLNLPIGMETRKDLLKKEGHTITLSVRGTSYQVVHYKDHMFDLNLLRPIMPPKEDASEFIF